MSETMQEKTLLSSGRVIVYRMTAGSSTIPLSSRRTEKSAQLYGLLYLLFNVSYCITEAENIRALSAID